MGPHSSQLMLMGMPGLPSCHEHPKIKGRTVIGQGSGSAEQLLSNLKAVPDYQLWDYLAGGVEWDLTVKNNSTCPCTPQIHVSTVDWLDRLQGPPLVTMAPEEPYAQQIALPLPGTKRPLKSHLTPMDAAIPKSRTMIEGCEGKFWYGSVPARISPHGWKSWSLPAGSWLSPDVWEKPQFSLAHSSTQLLTEEFWWSGLRTWIGFSHFQSGSLDLIACNTSVWQKSVGVESGRLQNALPQANITPS